MLTNNQLEDRVIAIENRIADLETAMNALATKQMVKQLIIANQAELTSSDTIEADIDTIEEKLNEIQTAINALATKTQLKQLVLLREQNQQSLEGRVTTLESAVAILQSS